ncbi:glycosyltransferase [Moritella sp. 28]|uniref:glycosyltransferase n=1 Tax=Moritella sp. 28 TaxID=2746232 RepID=UPI001BA9AAF3|nr:glycosyltransferase [Moritella sp. 28]QUM85338.1 glycosyltransferase [Moritella sp. 28]
MKTKVLIVISNMEFGGAQRQVIELVNNIDQTRFEIHVCSLSEYVPLADQMNKDTPLHIIHKKAKFDFSVVFKLAKLVRQYKFNVIHSYLFDAEIAARLAGKLSCTDIKIIGSERNTNYTLKPIQKKAYKLTKHLVSDIIANSQSGAKFNASQTGQPSHKYHVVYNGVDTKRFKPQDKLKMRRVLGIDPDCKLIGMFASFKQQKNHPFLIEALEQVKAQGISFKLLLVGDTLYDGLHGSDHYTTAVKQQIKDSGFSEDTIYLGNRDDIEQIYPACDFTVLPSLFEGTPNVVLESMACGVPVIATNVSDNKKIITDTLNGYIIDLNNTEQLSNRIITLYEDKEKLELMAIKSRAQIEHFFSSKRLAENTQLIYCNKVL